MLCYVKRMPRPAGVLVVTLARVSDDLEVCDAFLLVRQGVVGLLGV
jgi:hypothetical protein